MSRFITDASGARVRVDDPSAPAQQPEPSTPTGPPMVQRGWVDDFLAGPTESQPLNLSPRPHRRASRRSRRRF